MDEKLGTVYTRLYKARKMVILTGAGISCNAGIPDFRSSQGLYNMTHSRKVKGKDLFDISLFNTPETLEGFARFMSNLYLHTQRAQPTTTHKFIAGKMTQGKVLRCYTQNIDGIESKCGLNMSFDVAEGKTPLQRWKRLEVVQLHGDMNALSCTNCGKLSEWEESKISVLQDGELPECTHCVENVKLRKLSGKRTTGQVGLLRPNIVLYGENHPESDIITKGLNSDMRTRPDMLLIMGTSLKVDGIKKLVKSLSVAVHSRGGLVVLVNKERLAGWDGVIDHQIQQDCDSFVLGYGQQEAEWDRAKTKTKINKTLLTPPTSPKKTGKRAFTIYEDPHTPMRSPSKRAKHSLPTPPSSRSSRSGSGVRRVLEEHNAKCAGGVKRNLLDNLVGAE